MTTTIENAALAASGLGRRYRRGWALRDCTFTLPIGRVAALIGPNGAGKSTLMALATGLLRATAGTIRVLGTEPGRSGSHPRLAFLAQAKPLYGRFTVAELLRAGRALNQRWDQRYAEELVRKAGVRFDARISTLSGGQRTRVALAAALGRRPAVLMLDEPLADLDPLAREEVMRTVMAEVAETGMTVLLSSHVLADLAGVCDHLLLLAGGRVHLSGDLEDLIAEHRLLIGARQENGHGLEPSAVVEYRTTQRQETILVRAGLAPASLAPASLAPASAGPATKRWKVLEPTLEELTMAYLRAAAATPGLGAREAGAA